MKIAKDFTKSHNKPKGTKVSRVPQGTEDSTFKSFFDGFYPHVVEDYGTDNSTTKNSQDMSELSRQAAKAKELMFDKLGPMAQVTKKVYVVGADFHELTEITDPRENGKFFAESCYVVYLKSV